MLRPKKKITKRALKEDALITSYVKMTSFYGKHKKNISIGITALVVLILASVVYLKNRSDNNERAMTQLGQVIGFYDSGQYQSAIDGVPERNIPGLKSIVENYGNSHGGDIARFYLANACFYTGRYEDALKNFKDFGTSEQLLEVSRLAGIGSCNEVLGNHRDAAEYFEKAATEYSKDINAAENLNNAARNYAQAGDKERAIELYRKLKKNFPTTVYARDADRFISQLSV
jgi:tetratricopeptide (TPR) repeat protein